MVWGETLKGRLSGGFAMASDPSSVVALYMSIQGEGVVWQPILRRGAFDWEIPWVTQLLERLQEA